MKPLIASFAVLSLVAVPALAVTNTTPTAKTAKSEAKAQAKAQKASRKADAKSAKLATKNSKSSG